VKSLNVSEFRKQALDLLEHLPPEGVLITKRGKPLAKVVPMRSNIADLIGSMKGKLHIKGDIFSTGIRWEAEDGKIDGEPIR
jgi:antitoxin (DNA-binding transcriptional repressor) of toxin-antitoxin stability system